MSWCSTPKCSKHSGPATAVVPDYSNRTIQAKQVTFLAGTFLPLQQASSGGHVCPSGQASEEQSEAAPRPVQMGCLIADIVYFIEQDLHTSFQLQNDQVALSI